MIIVFNFLLNEHINIIISLDLRLFLINTKIHLLDNELYVILCLKVMFWALYKII